ncbi:tRNA-histidine guanylyltransferase 1 [Radiomyces spectabilis]|uniref:tRNA-histidine guanylyltransferase 1 n=1 Tax=Radiomyces spectabilis TaxID=64574 RepID=UPI0022209BE7|nr:tRNA-histidine guanylyltransferase 1 [Radiomyces spectabilis]KAI8375981.1 tRNA-histidine guanylyltransferase 1 [Radiomyces spectabilis]
MMLIYTVIMVTTSVLVLTAIVQSYRDCISMLKQILYKKKTSNTLSSFLPMANSKFEYVRRFETDDSLLPNTWLAVRIDGRGFHRFSQTHDFAKPNDRRAIDLMNRCAIEVMKDVKDIILAYGQSDEYSFILPKECNLYSRRASKIASTVVSLFASNYVMHWHEYFGDQRLQYAPCFDSRVVCYPSDKNMRDYLSWRQADCHINNLYNTTFWAIVHSGKTETEAEEMLRGTFSKDKHEMLFTNYGINYNNLDPIYKKGSVIVREKREVESVSPRNGEIVRRLKAIPVALHEDIIGESFWNERPHLLGSKSV